MIYRRMVETLANPKSLWVLAALCAGWVLGGFRFGFQTDWYQFLANTPLSWGAQFITLLVLVDARQSAHEAQRENRALHLKLDAVIAAIDKASNRFIGIETADETVLDELAEVLVPAHDAPVAAEGAA